MFNRLLFFLFLSIPLTAWAQISISGVVYDFDNKSFPLQGVKVRNLTDSHVVTTKASGYFTVKAKNGDVLEFSLSGFHTDTLFLIDLKPKTIYLPANSTNLNEVKIVGAKMNSSIFAADPELRELKRFNTDDLRGKKNNDKAGGMFFNLGYGKYKRQEAKIQAYEERDKYEAEINKIFTAAYVSDLVKLKGEDLKDFMALYRPTSALVQGERPFNYAYYTVTAYHAWLRLPLAQRRMPALQKLKSD